MDLPQKIRSLPAEPGVYLYKNDAGEVIYVGKAKNLRSRVGSYFHQGREGDAKTGTLVREAADLDYIVVANEKEALALENNLIKQKKPRFNILLRDDKTYPYVKLTLGERFPRVYVTRRLRKDGAGYYGPYFPANLAYRIADLIHRHFLVPSCKVDLTRYHPRPCLQYYIRRCLGPCVKELTTPEIYQEAVRDVKLFLEGRPTDLSRSLRARMEKAAEEEEYERAAKYRDLISTVEQLQEKQRIAAVEGDDADVFGYHYENGMLAVNLFHMRGGRVLDRREFFWEELPTLEASGGKPGEWGTLYSTTETAPGRDRAGIRRRPPPSTQLWAQAATRLRTGRFPGRRLISIRTFFFPPCSVSFISGSPTCRGIFTFRCSLKIVRCSRRFSRNKRRARGRAPDACTSSCPNAGKNARSSIWQGTTRSSLTISDSG